MNLHVNPFVVHLNRYTTVSPEHEAAFDEFLSQELASTTEIQPLRIETKTEQFIRQQFQQIQPPCIILTGNAGDGKTYLCRQIIKDFTGEDITQWPPEVIQRVKRGDLTLNVVKDLSEVGEDAGVKILEQLNTVLLQEETQDVFLIAANEGRLRALLSQGKLSDLHRQVDKQLREEPALNQPQLLVLNLNQVTTSSYVQQTIAWLTQKEYWKHCQECPTSRTCPIYFNAGQLSNDFVVSRLKFLYQILEHLGVHLTIRDMLIHLVYTVTGGLNCQIIAERNGQAEWKDQRHFYVYYENVWGETADEIFQRKILATRYLRRLDVGNVSVFNVDDFIINGSLDEETQKVYDDLLGERLDLGEKLFSQRRFEYLHGGVTSPKPEEEHPLIAWLPHCRRKLFFEWENKDETNRLLSFAHLPEYFRLIEGDTIMLERCRKNLILGLNRSFSGLFLSEDNNAHLYVTSQYAHAVEQPVPIIRTRISASDIELILIDETSEVFDRNFTKLVLDIPPPTRVRDADPKKWSLGLLTFEYLMRRACGGTSNVLATECELKIRRLKDELLQDFAQQESDPDHIFFFGAHKNRYVLQDLRINEGKIQTSGSK
ncbi:MAG: hypothetical protein JW725_05270 [Candidatus Babeliaceae bacterium]|nr:hypothetical protein [Candidatus Babeliaceae bacterium]